MNEHYSNRQIALHWLMGGLLFALAVIGFVMSDAEPEGALRLWLSRAHAVLGVSMGALLLARIVIRFRSPPVAELPHSTGPQRTLMKVVHVGIYVALALVLFSGMATSILGDWSSYLLGSVPSAPDLHEIPPREGHELFVFALLGLVGAHVAGVVMHEVRKGGALRRMLPGASSPKG